MTLVQKTTLLKQLLELPQENYADSFKTDVSICLENYASEELEKLFLSKISNETELRNWIDKLTSRIVMHEEDDNASEIIHDYISGG